MPPRRLPAGADDRRLEELADVNTPLQGNGPMATEPDRRSPPCALVIFGASGDLTARKLMVATAESCTGS